MSDTARTLSRLSAFARAIRPDSPEVDRALADLRALLARERVSYVIVGGVAVVHHGYARTTRDVDVLLGASDLDRIQQTLEAAGFEREGRRKWRHVASGAGLDVLLAGEPIPPAGRGAFPEPSTMARSDREPDIAALSPLVALKLAARRHQDLADVVGLLQALDESRYLDLESALPGSLSADLARLRADALDELAGGG